MKKAIFISPICLAVLIIGSELSFAQVKNESINFNTTNPIILSDTINKSDKNNGENKIVLKSDTNQNKSKLKTAHNSITFQPIGLFLLFSNIEYDRAVSNKISTGLKINFTTFLLRNMVKNMIKGNDTKEAIGSLTSIGIGSHIRFYTGNRPVEGFFFGGAIDGNFFKYDKVKSNTDSTGQTVTTKSNQPGNLWRIEFEIGVRSKLSKSQGGFTIQWTLGAGAGFVNVDNKSLTIPMGSFGFGIGYSF